MTLYYEWENCPKQSLNSSASYKAGEPIYRNYKGYVQYEYEKKIKVEDIVEYLQPIYFKQKENKEAFQLGVIKLFHFLIDNNALDIDSLEDDAYFVEYMQTKYEDEAYEKYKESLE